MKTTKEELAKMLDGREYRKEDEGDIVNIAKASNLVFCYGYSDDLVELDGAFRDETSEWYGTGFAVTEKGIPTNQCTDSDCPYYRDGTDGIVDRISARFGEDGDEFTWMIDSTIPHATFRIVETTNGGDDEENFCRGIVFSLDDLQPLKQL